MRIAIYARFSSDMQSKHSADDQIRECREYAQRQGWEVVLVDRDEAVSAGAIASRDGYARLIEAARAHRFDVLLVEEVSRFSRDFLGGMVELQSLSKVGVKIADTRNGVIDLDSAAGQMLGAVNLMMAHQEKKKLGERSRRGIKGKVLNKFLPGGKPAYGYTRVPIWSDSLTDVDGRPKRIGVRMEPDPETAPVVVRIFELFASGASKGEIARVLNEQKIPTRDAGKTYAGRANLGTWSRSTIKNVLENEVYRGARDYGKTARLGEVDPKTGKKRKVDIDRAEWTHVADYCEAIVSPDLWSRAQEKLRATAVEYAKHHVAQQGRRNQFLLSGLIKCGQCGHSYVIGSVLKGQKSYRCGVRASRGNFCCSNRTYVPAMALEAKIKLVLDSMAKDPAKLAELVAEHNARVAAFNADQTATVRRLEGQLAEAKGAMARLVMAMETHNLGDVSELTDRIAVRRAEATSLTEQIATAKASTLPTLEPTLRPADFVSGTASLWTGNYQTDRARLEELIVSVTVHPSREVTLTFRRSGLFGRVTAYEIRPERAKPAAPPNDADAVLKTDRGEYRVHVKAPGSAAQGDADPKRQLADARLAHRQAAMFADASGAGDRRLIDLGHGTVAVFESSGATDENCEGATCGN